MGETISLVPKDEFYTSLPSVTDKVNVDGIVDILKEKGESVYRIGGVEITGIATRVKSIAGYAIGLGVAGQTEVELAGPEAAENIREGMQDEILSSVTRRFPKWQIEFWNDDAWQWPATLIPDNGGLPIMLFNAKVDQAAPHSVLHTSAPLPQN